MERLYKLYKKTSNILSPYIHCKNDIKIHCSCDLLLNRVPGKYLYIIIKRPSDKQPINN